VIIFTDEVMLVLAAVGFVMAALLTAAAIYWRDWDALWGMAACFTMSLYVIYYLTLVQTPGGQVEATQAVQSIARPATFSGWALGLAYGVYRFRVKWQSKRR
jgi:hypothetical protein